MACSHIFGGFRHLCLQAAHLNELHAGLIEAVRREQRRDTVETLCLASISDLRGCAACLAAMTRQKLRQD
jgi:hypothetical protein